MRGINVSDETQFVYGTLGRSPVLQQATTAGTGRALAMFQSYQLKQAEFLNRNMYDDWGVVANFFLYSGMAARAAGIEFGVDTSQYSGVGSMIPQNRPDSPMFVSPPVNLIGALFGFTNAGDSTENVAGAVDNIERLVKASIPGYLQAVRFGRSYKALKEGIREAGPQGTLIETVPDNETVAAALGMPRQSTALRQRTMEGIRDQKDQKLRLAEEMQSAYSDLRKALAAGDGAKADQARQKIGTMAIANRYDFDQTMDNLHAAQRGYDLTLLFRLAAGDKKAAMQSGRLAEAERAGLDWTSNRRTAAGDSTGGY
jgi:hypothetical protein